MFESVEENAEENITRLRSDSSMSCSLSSELDHSRSGSRSTQLVEGVSGSTTRHFLVDGGRGSREWLLSSCCTQAWISPVEEFSLCNSWIMSSLWRLCSWDLQPTTLWSRRPTRLCSRRPLRLCSTIGLELGLCPSFWVMPELCPAPSSYSTSSSDELRCDASTYSERLLFRVRKKADV